MSAGDRKDRDKKIEIINKSIDKANKRLAFVLYLAILATLIFAFYLMIKGNL